MLESVTAKDSKAKRVVTNTIVPGALGGFSGNIYIPADWSGKYELSLKITRYSTYTNWLAASTLARTQPQLFAADSGRRLLTASNALQEQGIQRLDYTLDESRGKMVLEQKQTRALRGSGDDPLRLYASEVEAPAPIKIDVNVHDIDVSHRVYRDYYGAEMLEITICNYYNNDQPIHLGCTVYEDDATVGRNYTLPHDSATVSAGKTQTITIPLSALTDPEKHEKIRVVIVGYGIDETAMFNNEFTIYLGGKPNEQPQPTPTPTPQPVPKTGDRDGFGFPVLLMLVGAAGLLVLAIRKKNRQYKRNGQHE